MAEFRLLRAIPVDQIRWQARLEVGQFFRRSIAAEATISFDGLTSRDLRAGQVGRAGCAGGEDATIGVIADRIAADLASADQGGQTGLAGPAIARSAGAAGAAVTRQFGRIDVKQANQAAPLAAQRIAIDGARGEANEGGEEGERDHQS